MQISIIGYKIMKLKKRQREHFMRCKTFLPASIIAILLIIGTGGTAMAQTGTDPVLTGYFVSINLQPSGPFDTADLRQLIGNGQLTRDSLVWKEGMASWVMAGTVAELTPLFSVTPPPLPGTTQVSTPPPLPGAAATLAQTPPPVPATPPPQQSVSQTAPKEPWGGHPFLAGSINTVFGIWSFTNNDISGGILTTALQASGVALAVVGLSLYSSWYYDGGNYMIAYIMYLTGYGVTAAGSVYGFVRGFTQYNRKMAASRSFTEAISENPLNNISLVAFPASDDRRVVGAVTYSLSY